MNCAVDIKYCCTVGNDTNWLVKLGKTLPVQVKLTSIYWSFIGSIICQWFISVLYLCLLAHLYFEICKSISTLTQSQQWRGSAGPCWGRWVADHRLSSPQAHSSHRLAAADAAAVAADPLHHHYSSAASATRCSWCSSTHSGYEGTCRQTTTIDWLFQ